MPRTSFLRSRRRGSLSMEFILICPLLIGLIFAMVQFAWYLAAEQQLALASREGARVAALGGTEEEILQATRCVLGSGPLGCAEICVSVKDAQGQPIPSGKPVAVMVRIPASQAVPNLLAIIGFC